MLVGCVLWTSKLITRNKHALVDQGYDGIVVSFARHDPKLDVWTPGRLAPTAIRAMSKNKNQLFARTGHREPLILLVPAQEAFKGVRMIPISGSQPHSMELCVELCLCSAGTADSCIDEMARGSLVLPITDTSSVSYVVRRRVEFCLVLAISAWSIVSRHLLKAVEPGDDRLRVISFSVCLVRNLRLHDDHGKSKKRHDEMASMAGWVETLLTRAS